MRLVIDRQKLFDHCQVTGCSRRAGAAAEDDAFALCPWLFVQNFCEHPRHAILPNGQVKPKALCSFEVSSASEAGAWPGVGRRWSERAGQHRTQLEREACALRVVENEAGIACHEVSPAGNQVGTGRTLRALPCGRGCVGGNVGQ